MENTIVFKCPKCGHNVLEWIGSGTHYCNIERIYDDGIIEYGFIESEGDTDRWQCNACGYVLTNEYGEDIINEEELIEWLKDNCS